jgi:hypothetical protein
MALDFYRINPFEHHGHKLPITYFKTYKRQETNDVTYT